NIDGLAQRGIRFSKVFVPAPVCSACRSALMAGKNQIRINAHEHRSSRGPVQIQLPDTIRLLPRLMKESGYFTFNAGKTDYNFQWDEKATYSLLQNSRSNVPWETIKESQPFFGQIQTAGGKNNTKTFPTDRKVNPSEVTVPPDYPQNELYQKVVAQHYDAIRKDDDFIGEILRELEKHGLTQNTIVVYFSDHGANNLVRHKQMPTEGGLHVPFIIAGPDPYVPATSVRDDLVNMLDLSATTLCWAGLEVPGWHEGQNLFAEKLVPRSEVFAAKDRLDHTIDRVRTVRSSRFRYTRNFKTDRILLQPQYRDNKDYVVNLRNLYATNQLTEPLKQIYFGERPKEELYDIEKDPSQLKNLCNDPMHEEVLERHRNLLEQWIRKGDMGSQEEPLQELAYQASGHKWGEGVNPEYELVREDGDGDGLSDEWERLNSRDPNDSRLMFLFDCGGWQTEGWYGDPELENLAGYLGFLDFTLTNRKATIRRENLKIPREAHPMQWEIKARATGEVKVQIMANFEDTTGPQTLATALIKPTGSSEVIPCKSEPLGDDYGALTGLEIHLEGSSGTRVEIDSIITN
ncbi:MAG: sulfatase-like hydrolase/transferase, partial [Rubripirellula sp.]